MWGCWGGGGGWGEKGFDDILIIFTIIDGFMWGRRRVVEGLSLDLVYLHFFRTKYHTSHDRRVPIARSTMSQPLFHQQ